MIANVKFNPTTVRSRTKPIRAQLTVKDTRGYLVRDAIVLIRGVPENRVHSVKEARTNQQGVVVFSLKPTKLLPLRPGGRLTIFTRARKAGEPINGGVSTRRLVSPQLTCRAVSRYELVAVPGAWRGKLVAATAMTVPLPAPLAR